MTTTNKKTPNKIPLPEYVHPLGTPYRVELSDNLDSEELGEEIEPTWGETRGDIRRIKILSTQDTRRQWTTLLHEYIHASLYVNGVSSYLSESVEEVIVQSLEHSLEQFMLHHGDSFMRALEVQK